MLITANNHRQKKMHYAAPEHVNDIEKGYAKNMENKGMSAQVHEFAGAGKYNGCAIQVLWVKNGAGDVG